jgi:hypothetical protein
VKLHLMKVFTRVLGNVLSGWCNTWNSSGVSGSSSWWYAVMRMCDAAVCHRLIQIGNSFSLGSLLNNHAVTLKELNAVI